MPEKSISEFNGLWIREGVSNCPPDHFIDSRNLRFDIAGNTFNATAGKVGTREGTTSSTPISSGNSIRRARIYKPNSPWTSTDGPRPIILDYAGNLIDTKFPAVNLVTNANATDFSLVNFFGRCLISLSNGKTGLSGVNLYIYDGTGAAGWRTAGGAAPTVAPVVAMSVGTGNLGVGKYLFRYAYETNSGFITPPSAMDDGDSFGSYSANVDVTAGPAGTAAIWILATQAIPTGTYNGNPEGYPYFFVSREANATATINVSFFDEELIDSADYLFDELTAIPSGVGLYEYNGRAVVIGEYANPSIIRVSKAGEPEAFSETSGLKTVDPADTSGLRGISLLQGTLYLFGNSTAYATRDNGEEVSTWDFDNFSNGVGTEHYGISQVFEEMGSNSNYFLIASLAGLILFNGSFIEPALTWKIEGLWKRINKEAFTKVEVHIDPEEKMIYVACPIDGSTFNNCLLVGNYTRGMNHEAIRWDRWEIGAAAAFFPESMVIYRDYAEARKVIVFSGLKQFLFSWTRVVDDVNTFILSYIAFGPIRYSKGISSFNKFRGRILGVVNSNQFTIQHGVQGGSGTITYTTIGSYALPQTFNQFQTLFNLVADQCYLKFGLLTSSALGYYFRVDWVILEGALYGDEIPRP